MKYLLKDITIFEGTFERGQRKGQKYRWLRASLYNETNFRANPRQLPLYFAFSEDEVGMYMPYAKPNAQRPGSYTVNSVDIENAMKADSTIPDLLHVDNMFKVTMPLPCPYARIYNAQVRDATTGAVLHEKGDPIIAEGQTQPVPVQELTMHLMKVVDNETGEITWRDDPATEMRRILERSYKPFVPTADQAQTATAPEAPTASAPTDPTAIQPGETPEQYAARLRAELEAASKA